MNANGIGLFVRFWQLGIEMRPFFNRGNLWTYPAFGGAGAGFGYWLDGVEKRQRQILDDKRQTLLEKRRRRDEREEKKRASRGVEGQIDGAVGRKVAEQEGPQVIEGSAWGR